VNVKDGPDSLSCGSMELEFEKPTAATTQPDGAEQPGKRDKRRGPALDVDDFSKRSIAQITCREDVVMEGVRFDENQRLLQRVSLTAEKELRYQAESRIVNCTGPGTMSAEDYRRPGPAGEKDARPLGTGMQRPSQTFFEWRDGMQWSRQQDGPAEVVLNGGVKMQHHSGSEVVLAEKLNTPDWGKLTSGRRTSLNCGKLVAKFVESAGAGKSVGTAASKPAAEPSEDITGRLDLELKSFFALGQVDLQDGSTRITGHRLDYDRGTVNDYASVEGKGVFPATLVYEDADGKVIPVRSSKIDIHFKDGHVVKAVAEGVSATAGQ